MAAIVSGGSRERRCYDGPGEFDEYRGGGSAGAEGLKSEEKSEGEEQRFSQNQREKLSRLRKRTQARRIGRGSKGEADRGEDQGEEGYEEGEGKEG